jgi:hypothetical protein
MPDKELADRIARMNAERSPPTTKLPDGELLDRVREVRAKFKDSNDVYGAREWMDNADKLLADIEQKLTRE